MVISYGSFGQNARSYITATPERERMLRAGLLGGAGWGRVCIWIYEAIVWVGAQQMMPLGGIRLNATEMVLGKAFQEALGPGAHILGTAIHFFFCLVWGVLFCCTYGLSSVSAASKQLSSPCSMRW